MTLCYGVGVTSFEHPEVKTTESMFVNKSYVDRVGLENTT